MSKWVTVWGNATSVAEHRPETYAKNITLRYLVTPAFGGNKVRLHFSNFCGTEPVTLNKVTLAPAISDREMDTDGKITLTFSGKESVTIGAGEEIFSDEADFLAEGKPLAVSIYLKDYTLMRSGVVVTGPLSKGFFSVGDTTDERTLPLDFTRTLSTYYFLTGIDFFTDDKNRCVICYGDSITSQSWPDYLALKFMEDKDNRTAVIRRAASGTRVLKEYKCITYESYGLSGRHRFEREISTVSGADTVIIQQGINDIIHPVGTDINPFRPMSDLPTSDELEEGIKYYVKIAKDRNLRVLLGTLLPIYGWRTYAPFREEMKNEFNGRIRANDYADGYIDFDRSVRSDSNPFAFREGFDSGDHLHPSEKAYAVMAQTAYGEINK